MIAWWRQEFEAPPTTACNSRRGLPSHQASGAMTQQNPYPKLWPIAPPAVHHTIGGLTMRERIRSLIAPHRFRGHGMAN
jgi:hypothetical protein